MKGVGFRVIQPYTALVPVSVELTSNSATGNRKWEWEYHDPDLVAVNYVVLWMLMNGDSLTNHQTDNVSLRVLRPLLQPMK